MSLAVLERSRKKQSARISNLREGDANTRYFHLRVNGRRRKNYIQRLMRNDGWVTSHAEKEAIVHDHFSTVLQRPPPRTRSLNWDAINIAPTSLDGIDSPILEAEVLHAISSMPSDKAPGPDGYTGAFFKACWLTIKPDIMRVINLFSNLHGENFHWLNSAFVALLPKKDGAEGINDFRPISLIRAIAKIISKVLALPSRPT